MLSDIDLFIITWILLLTSITSLAFQKYASVYLFAYKIEDHLSDEDIDKIRWSKKTATSVRNVSAAIFICTTILGVIIGVSQWIPITELNPEPGFSEYVIRKQLHS